MSQMDQQFASSTRIYHGGGPHIAAAGHPERLQPEMTYRNTGNVWFVSTKRVITVLTMFPRQDVGAKGSSPVQEPLRQPVYAEMEQGVMGNGVFPCFVA